MPHPVEHTGAAARTAAATSQPLAARAQRAELARLLDRTRETMARLQRAKAAQSSRR